MRALFYGAVLTISFDIFLVIRAGFNFRIAQILLLVPVFLALARALATGKAPWPPGFHYLLAWTGFLLLFVPNAGLPERGVGYGVWHVFNVLLVFSTVSLFDTGEKIRPLLRWYLFSFVAVAAFGLLQFTLPFLGVEPPLVRQWWIPGSIARVNGFSYEPSYFATYLLMGWILSAYLLQEGGNRFASRKTLVFSFTLLTLALVLSSSRMGWIMMALWCLRYPLKFGARALRGRIHRRLFLASAGIAAFAGLAVAAGLSAGPKTVELLLSGTGIRGASAHSAGGRLQELTDTLDAFRKSPLLGYSLGGVASAVGEVRGVRVAGLDDAKWNEGMNVFAEVLAASGIVGFIPFLLYVAFLFLAAVRTGRRSRDGNLGVLLMGMAYSFLFEILILQFNQNILRPYLWLHIGILSALCNVAARSRETAAA